MVKRLQCIIVYILVTALCISNLAPVSVSAKNSRSEKGKIENANGNYGLSNPRASVNFDNVMDEWTGEVTWDCIWFGEYYNNYTYGKDPIKWRVLKVDGDDAFIISEEILDAVPFNEIQDSQIEYSNSTVRSWLNGYGSSYNKAGRDYSGDNFINNCFNSAEQAAIKPTILEPDSKGNMVEDKIYLVSSNEIENGEYGFYPLLLMFAAKGFMYSTRVAKASAYAEKKGVWTSWFKGVKGDKGVGQYYLRDTGSVSQDLIGVNIVGREGYPLPVQMDYRYRYSRIDNGKGFGSFDIVNEEYEEFGEDYTDVDDAYGPSGIRPALHIDLSKNVWKNAGTVTCSSSEATAYEEKNTPTLKNAQKRTLYKGLGVPQVSRDVRVVWDCIWFGEYYNKTSDTKEKIKWRVLDVKGNTAYIISDQVLDYKAFDESGKTTYVDSDIRAWLNNEFKNNAFSEKELESILITKVTDHGQQVEDMIALPTLADTENLIYGFSPLYTVRDRARECYATDYAVKKGLKRAKASSYTDYVNWLVWYDSADGKYVEYGYDGPVVARRVLCERPVKPEKGEGIRPVLHIDLSRLAWKHAGTVDTKRLVDENAWTNETTGGAENNTELSGSVISVSGNILFKGQVTVKGITSSLTLDLNGGDTLRGSYTEKDFGTNNGKCVKFKKPVKKGYTFLGYYDTDGRRVTVLNVKYLKSHKDICLTAMWKENLYGIYYKKQKPEKGLKISAKIIAQRKIKYSVSVNLAEAISSDDGSYTIVGWALTPGKSVPDFKPGQQVSMLAGQEKKNKRIILYPVWKKN